MFPISKLAEPIWESLCDNFNFLEIFNLSLCSKQCSRLISFGRLQITRLSFEVLWNEESHINCTLAAKNKGSIFFYFRKTPECEEELVTEMEHRRINGVDFRLDVTQGCSHSLIYCYCENAENGAKAIVSHLLSFVVLPIKELSLTPINSSIVDELLKFSCVRRAETIELDARGMSWDMTKMLLSSLSELKTVILGETPTGEPCKLPEIQNVDSLFIKQKGWLWIDDVCALNCKRIHMKAPMLCEADLNEYLKRWKRNPSGRLEYLEVAKWDQSMKMNQITGELKAKKWDKKNRDEFYLFEETGPLRRWVDCGTGHDIERSDGVLGTVKWEFSKVRFLVWKERFPYKRIHAEILDPHFSGAMGFNNASKE